MSTVGTRWYTITEAAPIIGVSTDTVRRRVKRGQLESRQVRTQHGPTWEICIGDVLEESVPVAEGTQGAAYGAEGGSQDRSQAMATWAASLLGPIAAELGEARQSMERQAETIRDQAETIGRQGAELERATSTVVALGDELAAIDASRRRASRLLIAGAVLLACLAVVAGAFAAMAWLP